MACNLHLGVCQDINIFKPNRMVMAYERKPGCTLWHVNVHRREPSSKSEIRIFLILCFSRRKIWYPTAIVDELFSWPSFFAFFSWGYDGAMSELLLNGSTFFYEIGFWNVWGIGTQRQKLGRSKIKVAGAKKCSVVRQ